MIALIVVAHAVFLISIVRRWQMLRLGAFVNRFDRIGERVAATWRYAFRQEKMQYYQPAGIAHLLIFGGFMVLLLRTLILWGRGIDPTWNLIVLSPATSLGRVYEFAKDLVAIGVIAGAFTFVYFRVIKPQKRMTLSGEGLLILGIIITMMFADMIYDGASLVLQERQGDLCAPGSTLATADQCEAIRKIVAPLPMGTESHAEWRLWPSPAGSAFAVAFHKFGAGALVRLAQLGFWTHSTLVLIFLNILPHSKHFHIITGIPNVFFKDMTPPGRLKPMADNAEKLVEKMMAASESPDPTSLPLGVARAQHFSWKSILDFYTCTECGRCSDNCPAHRTGKILSPKQLTLALRDHFYEHETELVETEMRWAQNVSTKGKGVSPSHKDGETIVDPEEGAIAREAGTIRPHTYTPIDLVPNVVHPDVLWACTTCRACEEQCPVLISYVDKIVDMRRNLVMIKNEFPHELQKPFNAIETNGNPWNLSRMDRAAWSDGLGVPTFAEKPTAEVLYWVGCAASYDDRAKKIARSTAKLLQMAGVDFAILGQEENCTGDPARRAGNELLFATIAEGNAATLNEYKKQGGMKTVVTACPHCFNTLKNEYPDFGAHLEVVHHTDYLMGLVAERKLLPKNAVSGKVVFHDSCYLGRYNGVYESPREILRSIPGVELVEAEYWNKQRGLCCGAGGAQMWMEEQNQNRVNVKRTLQLLDTGAKTIASGCPFCMTMLTDGVKSQDLQDKVKQMDVAELLLESCVVVEKPAGASADEPIMPPPPADAEGVTTGANASAE
jgi:Fe-S oxidoreductase